MSITGTVLKAVYDKVSGQLTEPVSPELRRAGAYAPAVVYELSNCEIDLASDGFVTGTGRATFRFQCVADSAATAYELALKVVSAIDGKWTGTGSCVCVLCGVSIQQSMASPDDGQEDAERIATVTAEIQFKEA